MTEPTHSGGEASPIVLVAAGPPEWGDVRAVIEPSAGGRLASLVVRGVERLVGRPNDGDRTVRWGSFLMAPWVGRLEDATFAWEGRDYPFEANLGEHALHGLLFYREWTVLEATPTTARLEIDLGRAGWPFGGVVRQEMSVSAVAIELTAEIVAGDLAMPVSLGWHPWFTRSSGGDSALRVPSAETLETKPDLIPTGRRVPVDTETDLREGPLLAGRLLDHTYVDVDGPVILDQPDLRIVVTASDNARTYVIHTPPAGICVEPQTGWPDAPVLASRGVPGTGLVRLGPGETLRVTTTWRWSAPTGDGTSSQATDQRSV